MARITTNCPRCGHVELGVEEVTLVVDPHRHGAWYLFDCLGCAHQVSKPAPGPVTSALTWIGVAVRRVPAEVAERDGGVRIPALTLDDLLDLVLGLRTSAPCPAVPARSLTVPLPCPRTAPGMRD